MSDSYPIGGLNVVKVIWVCESKDGRLVELVVKDKEAGNKIVEVSKEMRDFIVDEEILR